MFANNSVTRELISKLIVGSFLGLAPNMVAAAPVDINFFFPSIVNEGEKLTITSNYVAQGNNTLEYAGISYVLTQGATLDHSRVVGTHNTEDYFNFSNPKSASNSYTFPILRDDGIYSLQARGAVSYDFPGKPWYFTYSEWVSQEFQITVKNVMPTIERLEVEKFVTSGDQFTFSALATDPGLDDILTYRWDLDGDGEFNDFTGRYGSFQLEGSGFLNLGVQVSDGDGGIAEEFFEVEMIAAVPLPSAGWVLLAGMGFFAAVARRRA